MNFNFIFKTKILCESAAADSLWMAPTFESHDHTPTPSPLHAQAPHMGGAIGGAVLHADRGDRGDDQSSRGSTARGAVYLAKLVAEWLPRARRKLRKSGHSGHRSPLRIDLREGRRAGVGFCRRGVVHLHRQRRFHVDIAQIDALHAIEEGIPSLSCCIRTEDDRDFGGRDFQKGACWRGPHEIIAALLTRC